MKDFIKKILSSKWVKSTAIKTIKTMAQALIGVIGGAILFTQVDWRVALSTTLLSGIVCVLMNISNYKE